MPHIVSASWVTWFLIETFSVSVSVYATITLARSSIASLHLACFLAMSAAPLHMSPKCCSTFCILSLMKLACVSLTVWMLSAGLIPDMPGIPCIPPMPPMPGNPGRCIMSRTSPDPRKPLVLSLVLRKTQHTLLSGVKSSLKWYVFSQSFLFLTRHLNASTLRFRKAPTLRSYIPKYECQWSASGARVYCVYCVYSVKPHTGHRSQWWWLSFTPS